MSNLIGFKSIPQGLPLLKRDPFSGLPTKKDVSDHKSVDLEALACPSILVSNTISHDFKLRVVSYYPL